ncbi:MAG: beta-N-acetylhexosaminidase [Bryobacterales bacterium]|nr:beta-N-acetylhexosaminidase [Bryobacterales bacterium]
MRAILLVLAGCVLHAQPASTSLWQRGYSVIPTPQKVELGAEDIVFDATWSYRLEGLSPGHIAARSLTADLSRFHGITLAAASARSLVLSIKTGIVTAPSDPELARQAYRLRITPSQVEIAGNSGPGLLYGVQTFLQLLKPGVDGRPRMPEVTIEDWPKLQLRFLHWDNKHHQDRMETLKRYLDWAVRFKANMIAFELEDKFEYPSHPVIGAPGAFTAGELQEIVNYGLERFIQVVPLIQAPAHLSYVLKHPQFAHLRADGNNYQACLCDEESYKLIFQLYDDVIRATRGVDYFYVSTDEIYYAGLCAKCGQPNTEDFRSAKWAEFARRAHDHLAARGRRMLAWLEYPLLAKHLPLIPSSVIDGVIGEPEYIPIEKEKQMRQLIYTSLQGAEFLFPDHLPLDAELRESAAAGADDPLEFERGMASGRLRGVFESIAHGRAWQANPIGVFGAAWDDSGLHNEGFWIGWAAAARYGWHPGTPSPEQHAAEFMNIYYGARVTGMVEVYRTMQRQARAWQRTWDRVVSRTRGPGYGNSDGKGIGVTRYDQTLSMPPLPKQGTLEFEPKFAAQYRGFLRIAQARSLENDQLVHALHENVAKADRNHYNLHVMLALASYAGHHWRLLFGLAEAERSLARASELAKKNDAARAVGNLVEAYNRVGRIEREGLDVYRDLTKTFEVSMYPKGRSVNGRQFLQVLDDTKDHWAGRTAGWEFMFAAEQSMGIEAWRKQLRALLEAYAKEKGVPVQGLAEVRLEE